MGQLLNKQRKSTADIRGPLVKKKGVFLDSPNTEKLTTAGAGLGVRYGMAAMQGWRSDMEDAHCVHVGLPEPFSDWCLFAVFDGHAGYALAAHASIVLCQQVVESKSFRILGEQGGALTADEERVIVEEAIRESFLGLDDKMRELPQIKSGVERCGSTVVTVILSPRHIYLINCGDSKAVLARANTSPLSTPIHKPYDTEERLRIEKAGGCVVEGRINGYIAVSRALGDFHYKNQTHLDVTEQLITPEPDVISIQRDPSVDEFIVLACDGVWDYMTSEELVDIVRLKLRHCDDFEDLCKQIVDTCLVKGSRDNMSILLVTFDDSTLSKERSLNALIRSKVLEMIEKDPMELPTLMERMRQRSGEWSASLPPGVTIDQKSEFIETVYFERFPRRKEARHEQVN